MNFGFPNNGHARLIFDLPAASLGAPAGGGLAQRFADDVGSGDAASNANGQIKIDARQQFRDGRPASGLAQSHNREQRRLPEFGIVGIAYTIPANCS